MGLFRAMTLTFYFPVPEPERSSSGRERWDNDVEERPGRAPKKFRLRKECSERCLSNDPRCSDQDTREFTP